MDKHSKAGKVLLFDLGGVLIENNGRAALTALLPAPMEAAEIWLRWLESPSVRRFERGLMSPDDFGSAFTQEWQIRLDPAAFISEFATWPVGLYEGAAALLQGLKGRHHLACLSNTNAVHWQRFTELHGLLDSCFLSHEMGHVKPDREAFEYSLQKLGTRPQDVYFFDDLKPNVEAARETGMNAFQVGHFDDIEPILRAHGLYEGATYHPQGERR
jgi:glucose-1-phosphatase